MRPEGKESDEADLLETVRQKVVLARDALDQLIEQLD